MLVAVAGIRYLEVVMELSVIVTKLKNSSKVSGSHSNIVSMHFNNPASITITRQSFKSSRGFGAKEEEDCF